MNTNDSLDKSRQAGLSQNFYTACVSVELHLTFLDGHRVGDREGGEGVFAEKVLKWTN